MSEIQNGISSRFSSQNSIEIFFYSIASLDELDGVLGAHATDLLAVVAAEEDAEVYELVHAELHALEHLAQVELLDGHLAGLREGQVPKEDGGAEGQGVHVLGANGVDLTGLGELGALRLGLKIKPFMSGGKKKK